MTNNIQYTFYEGENTTTVDRTEQLISTSERSGWSRTYHLTFKQLVEYADKWDIKVDLNDSDAVIAEVATNIILANNAVEHNLDPYEYVPRSAKITDPRDLKVMTKFEQLLSAYDSDQVLAAMSPTSKEILKQAFLKNEI